MGEDTFDLIERRMARLEKKMEERMEEAFTPSWDVKSKSLEPLYDVREQEELIIVSVDLPWVRDKEDLEVHCNGDVIELEAKLCRPVTFHRWGTLQKETDFRCFRKIIPLPQEVDPEKAEAKFKDGLLTLSLPKKSRKRKIKLM